MLSRYLLGDSDFFASVGLIDRIIERVVDLSVDSGPQYKSGSVSGLTDHKPQPSSTDEAHIFMLYLRVREWLGLGSDPVVEARRLARHRKSDVELLTGKHGLLGQTKQRVKHLLAKHTDDSVDETLQLVDLFLDWLDGHCDHSLREMDAPDGITVLVCDCGVRVQEDRKGRWTAV